MPANRVQHGSGPMEWRFVERLRARPRCCRVSQSAAKIHRGFAMLGPASGGTSAGGITAVLGASTHRRIILAFVTQVDVLWNSAEPSSEIRMNEGALRRRAP